MASEAYEKKAAVAVAEPVEAQETEIDLMELLSRLWDKLLYIIMAALIGGLLVGGYSIFFVTPQYKSAAKIYVVSSKDSVVNLSDLQIGSYLTSDYQEVFNAWEVHEQVIQNLELDYSYEQMQEILSITNPANTRVLSIEVTQDDPQAAAKIANEYASVASEYIAKTMSMDKPNMLSYALPADAPFSPNKMRNAVIGIVLGALLAIVIITIRFVMDDKIRSTSDIEKYAGMPTLAVVPILDEKKILRMQSRDQKRDEQKRQSHEGTGV